MLREGEEFEMRVLHERYSEMVRSYGVK
jgi:hypothetical protein